MSVNHVREPMEVLLVEDNPGDVRLTREAFKEAQFNCNLDVVMDGIEALEYLFRNGPYADAAMPDLILLDLNLPRKDGRQVLREIKASDALKHIPVVILSTSRSEEDIKHSYSLQANCYISKPVDLDQFIDVIQQIKSFWFNIAALPGRSVQEDALEY